MSFLDILEKHSWNDIQVSIQSKTFADVEKALNSNRRTLSDFMALVSPAAEPYIEQMAVLSQQLTQKRFGKTIQLFTPLYLSNECTNLCTYCGFNYANSIHRKVLSDAEILEEVKVIKSLGFDHILLVTGEAPQIVDIEYFKRVVPLIKPYFTNISIEVQPLEEHEYAELQQLGVYAVLVYQETYNREQYLTYHVKGKKRNYDYRVLTPERVGGAGMHKVGLGILLGLEDWRTDSVFCAMHLEYLQKQYWRTKFSISFPRIRPAEGVEAPPVIVTDKHLVQLICAYRLFNEDVELSMSTRESQYFRNNIIPIGITSMSAGAKTNPGGYAVDKDSLEQFTVSDDRSPAEIVEAVNAKNYDVIWKDWDKSYV